MSTIMYVLGAVMCLVAVMYSSVVFGSKSHNHEA